MTKTVHKTLPGGGGAQGVAGYRGTGGGRGHGGLLVGDLYDMKLTFPV